MDTRALAIYPLMPLRDIPWKTLRRTIAIVGSVLGVCVLVYFLAFGAIPGEIAWRADRRVADDLIRLTGLSRYVINAIAATAAVAILLGLRFLRPRLGKGAISMSVATLVVMFIVYQLGLYALTRGTNFTTAGEAVRYYALTPRGVVYSDRDGVDPESGIAFRKMTPEVVQKLKMLERGEFKPVDPDAIAWFNPITGEPQLYYYRAQDGRLEFYDFPGFHPGTSEALQPVTKELREEYQARKLAAAAPPPAPQPVAPLRPTLTEHPPAQHTQRPADDLPGSHREPATGEIHAY